jgi:hypothetical protein
MRRTALALGTLAILIAAGSAVPCAHAADSIEFVTEHLAESMMDNRYASLPLWSESGHAADSWTLDAQAAYSRTTVGGLASDGPLFSLGVKRSLGADWSFALLAFYDTLDLSATRDERPLATLVSDSIPLALPADASFSGLNGSALDMGAGVAMMRRSVSRWGELHWVGGLLWQSVDLRDYRFDYVVLSGASTGTTGTVDYSATYDHLVAYGGVGLVRQRGPWSFSPHVLAVLPEPQRGVEACITGPGFDICGDTASAGNGKHFGDPFVAFGLGIGYQPWGLTFDLGGTLAQALVEPFVHPGIEENWLLSFDWRF